MDMQGYNVETAFTALLKNIWYTIPDILSILFLLVGSILLFGLMAFKLFEPRDFPGAPGMMLGLLLNVF